MKTKLAVLGGIVLGLVLAAGAYTVLVDDTDDTQDAGGRPLNASARDGEGDVVVFIDTAATDGERGAIEDAIAAHPDVMSYEYWDQEESLAEARRLFEDNADMLARITEEPELIPASYRVDLVSKDTGLASSVALDFEDVPGVMRATATMTD